MQKTGSFTNYPISRKSEAPFTSLCAAVTFSHCT